MAMQHMNHEVAIVAILHARDTLLPPLFLQILSSNSDVCSLYCAYLERTKNFDRLEALLEKLQATEDLLLLRIRRALSSPFDQKSQILAGIAAQAQSTPALSSTADILKEQVELIKRQTTIENFDAQIAARPDAEAVFRSFPRPSLPGTPLQNLLAYCMLYHPNAAPDKLSSAKGMRTCKDFALSDSRYIWTALRQRARVYDWATVQALTETKAMFGAKDKSPFGFVPFVEEICKNNGPEAMANKYCQLIEDKKERFGVALQHNLFAVCIDAAAELKDQSRLQFLRSHMLDTRGAEATAQFREAIDKHLANKKIKWAETSFAKGVDDFRVLQVLYK